MSSFAGHLTDERLQRFADGEIVEAEVRQHVDACAECARRLDEIEGAVAEYREYHAALKASDPAPPREWEDLRPRMTARPMPRWRVWGAVAATALLAFAAYDRMAKPSGVSAAELLRKAAAAEKPSNAPRRIRVKTAKREIVRPAFVAGGVASDLESMFMAARFSWQEPLSARSFSAWRDGLSEKQDTVREEDGGYEIETSTSEGPLRSARIVFDSELRPVRETLEFVNERVEIAVVEAEAAPGAVPSAPPAGVKPRAPAAGPSTELRALAALHAIGADLGEPVQVTGGDEVTVTASGLTEARERQVRAAVEAIPGVVYRVDEVPLADARGSERGAAVAQGRASQLAGILGEDGVNRILDASEAVMARVFALRGLSRRFPHVVEAQLADADRDVLASMRSEHVAGIRRHAVALQASVAPLLSGKPAPVQATAGGDWQAKAERLFTAAQAVDHLLTRVLAGGQDFSSLAPELGDALAKLDAEARQ